MKKLSIFALAALLVAMFSVPAMAIEHQFGGYFRTRFFANGDWNVDEDAYIFETDEETGATVVTGNTNEDLSQVDTRTRLYYTAVFSDNFKFINKFEYDATWGGETGWSRAAAATGNRSYGLVGADGANVEIKNSYVDFTTGMTNFRVGVQGFALASGFIMDDDGAGVTILAKPTDMLTLGFVWVRHWEGGQGIDFLTGEDNNDGDVDAIALVPTFKLGEAGTLKAEVGYFMSDNSGAYPRLPSDGTDLSLWYFGAAFDGSMGGIFGRKTLGGF